ncbi:alanine--tRNA ligase [Erysipelothrix amsterdamensis]|uniref:Alanine--tRNA ligase n=1 Tax=Erysipelothrix amsterdamensis TaxID=2929157 RepID=A0AAU9VF89_9FIRM|nr:alanine--tRNA ligase [Erysipelothrix sp. A18Y020d]CAH2761633.1 alanine--tRNA ligase [Erysipelothrix sp. A18Y020d]
MKQLTSSEIRTMFLDYFKAQDHMIEPGAPLVPIDDDTLLWINSGVAALKKYFDGRVKPKKPRIANVQKSLRTNDIDNVGKTARHHTFFEMLGNFSIGDYFKEEAIGFAYEFLFSSEWLDLDVNKAYFSVHTDDQEAFDIWVNKYNVSPSRILRTDDNFWQIGDGPCGPNSEIFYDRGEKYDPEHIGERLFFEDLENDRYVEVWNIVFSQFDGVEGGDIHTFKELPQKNIDTGMGFERLVSIVQDGETNFDTDLFIPIIQAIEALTPLKYKDNVMAYRVISDHIRSLVFTLADGAVFSNEGRGYVLRRILRRAVRFGKVLEIEGTFLHALVDDVIAVMGDSYPNLAEHRDMIVKLILSEEERFAKTLAGGEKLLLDTIEANQEAVITGDVAFKLYDTYGFPIELTQEIAEEHHVSVDLEGFKASLEEQKERARSSRQKVESMGSQQEDLLNFKENSEFIYDVFETQGRVVGLFVDGKRVDAFTGKGHVVFDKTCFYAESGGQVADTGTIESDSAKGKVLDVKKANGGQPLHFVDVDGTITMGQLFDLKIDAKRRILIRKNHSCVHLLHSALKAVVGDHVSQAGSYVDENYFRFDFSHFEKVTDEQLEKVELMINQWIAESLPITVVEKPLEEAKAMGAMALFSENYGSVVRVVTMGNASMELCGGTHAHGTGEIGVFKLVSEESVGSGVRRILGKTSFGAYTSYKETEFEVDAIRTQLKLSPQKSIKTKIEEMEAEMKLLEGKYKLMMVDVLKAKTQEYIQMAEVVGNDLSFVWIDMDDQEMNVVKELVERIRDHVDIVFVANHKASSVNFVVGCSDKAIKTGVKAGDLAKEAAITTGGNGGGKPNFAQAGGKDITKIEDAKLVISNKIA